MGVERHPLAGFEDIFEAELATRGTELRLLLDAAGQEVALKGVVLPPYSMMKKSGRAGVIAERVRANLAELETRLRRRVAALQPNETAAVMESVAVLDALLRAKRPYKAIVVS